MLSASGRCCDKQAVSWHHYLFRPESVAFRVQSHNRYKIAGRIDHCRLVAGWEFVPCQRLAAPQLLYQLPRQFDPR
jgi:hypothetical protein